MRKLAARHHTPVEKDQHGRSDTSAAQVARDPDEASGPHRAHERHGPHQQTRQVLNRLARTEGHIRAVRRMVDEGRPCAEVLIQLAAVRAAVDRVARVVLEDHVESCLRQAATNGTAEEEWRSLKEALDRFIT